MHVLVAPDSFTGSLTATAAASAIADGWQMTAPNDVVEQVPVSDGGPGFVGVLAATLPGRVEPVGTTGAFGQSTVADVLLVGSGDSVTAYIESAQCVGPDPDEPRRREPMTATSAGLAVPIRWAVEQGASTIVVGLGGSLITDGGAGLLAGLGATATDRGGLDSTTALLAGARDLALVDSVDLGPARAALSRCSLIFASDVDSPLLGPRGAARGYAPQKGASESEVLKIEAGLSTFATVLGRTSDGRDPAVALGSGAAGGLGYAMLHLGAERRSGIAVVLEAVGFAERVRRSDLVVTGEGSFDWQSLQGKVIAGVCAEAVHAARPVVVLAGRVSLNRREWASLGVATARPLYTDLSDPTDLVGLGAVGPANLEDSITHARSYLGQLAQRVARTWSR